MAENGFDRTGPPWREGGSMFPGVALSLCLARIELTSS